ncbi:MAG: hypothetical protein GKR89_23430 [Candidatus Latescibacteria bacterium]|nr:hypothetical protein [Candidatus Latescibacterota bacterium]
MHRLNFLFLFLLAPLGSIQAQTPPLNSSITLVAQPATTPLKIDGVLEDAWFDHAYFANFAEFMPGHQMAARVATEGYITHDEGHLLVAFVCRDPDMGKLRASLTDRDQIYQDDFVGLVLDTHQDQQRAYEFFSNPYGIQGDILWHANHRERDDNGAIWQANGGEDRSFDAVWEAEAKRYQDHWVVEMKIPFSSLRYPSQSQQEWAVHFVRVYPRENRYQFSWMPISQDYNSFMGQAGRLQLDLADSGQSRRSFELIPFVTGSRTDRLEDDGTGNGAWKNQDGGRLKASERLGFTGQYALSSNHVVDFAYRPDFSQIESDAGRLNANNPWAFFFAERRPFFNEGSDVFQVDSGASGMILDVANLIYTRSINDPTVATKITGQAGSISYGYISAYDDNTPLILPLADGTTVRQTRENSWSNIFRIKRDIAEQSHVGFAATNRRMDLGGANTSAAVETNLRLSDHYAVTAFAGLTYTDEANDAGLSASIPDVRFRAGGKTITAAFDGQQFYGHVFKTTLLRQGRQWNFNLSYQDYSPGFRADNSAIFSNDGRLVHTLNAYNFHFSDHPLFTLIRPNIYLWRKTDYEGDVKDIGIRPQLLLEWQRQTTLNIGGFLFNKEKYNGVKFDHARTLWIFAQTRAIEKVTGSLFFNNGESINRFGAIESEHNPLQLVSTLELSANLTLRPTDKMTYATDYDMVRLRQRNNDALVVRQQIGRGNVQYQFSKQLFIRLIGQVNWAKRAVSPGAYREDSFFSLEPMLSYKLNPFTVFFLGANMGGADDPYLNRNGPSLTDQTVFAKYQYLWSAF